MMYGILGMFYKVSVDKYTMNNKEIQVEYDFNTSFR